MRICSTLRCNDNGSVSVTQGWTETYEDIEDIQERLVTRMTERFEAGAGLTSISDDSMPDIHQFVLEINEPDADFGHWFWMLDIVGGVFD